LAQGADVRKETKEIVVDDVKRRTLAASFEVSWSTRRFSPFKTKLVGLVALALAGFGGPGTAWARSARSEGGGVETRGPAASIVVVGPVALHAYSEFGGGWLHTAPEVTGTDRDCQGLSSSATPLLADRIATFAVDDGQVVCLETTTKGSFELLWHAVSRPAVGRRLPPDQRTRESGEAHL
jgi:hypothetical protein